MRVSLSLLKSHGIKGGIDKTEAGPVLYIHGTEAMPSEAITALDQAVEVLAFTDRERDELVEHVADVRFWSTLKWLSS